MTHTLAATNWTQALAALIESAADGDTISVRNRSQAEMGKSALARMMPDKKLAFEWQVDDIGEDEDD